jgi:hypothetical protein
MIAFPPCPWLRMSWYSVFEDTIFACILVSTTALAISNSFIGEHSTMYQILYYTDLVINAVFTIELFLKVYLCCARERERREKRESERRERESERRERERERERKTERDRESTYVCVM